MSLVSPRVHIVCWVTSVVSDCMQPHRRQPTRLHRPWDSQGKNTAVLPFPSPMHDSKTWKWSCSVVSDSFSPMIFFLCVIKFTKNFVLLHPEHISVQFSHSVVSDSLWPTGLQHTSLPCPSSTPGACSNSCPLNRWCHPTMSSSVVPFSSCLQYFPASWCFPMSRFFPSGGQNIGVSASASVLPKNTQDLFPL